MQDQTGNHKELLKSVDAPSQLGIVGFGIIMIAFAMAIINFFLPTPSAFIKAILQPLIFVGVASLLYHIGQHVHALHENMIRMAMMDKSHALEKDEK